MTLTDAIEMLLGEHVNGQTTVDGSKVTFYGLYGASVTVDDAVDPTRTSKLVQLFRHERFRAGQPPTANERPTISITNSIVHGDVIARKPEE